MPAGHEPELDDADDATRPPRRRRQPTLAAMAILGVILLVLALGIFGGIF